MSCYHMNVLQVNKNSLVRKDGQISDFTNHIIFSNSPEFKGYEYYIKENERLLKKGEAGAYRFIPCGKCIGCRTEERKNWAIRIELEARQYDHNYFLTLTYDDEHLKFKDYTVSKSEWQSDLPIGYSKIYTRQDWWNGTLDKQDLRTFIKSLRKYIERDYGMTGLKFYACGEYGSKFQRPHYHLILMNCPEFDLKPIGDMNRYTKDAYCTNDRIQKIWGKGFIQINKATWDSISYTAGYCMKKLFGEVKNEYYAYMGQEPIFALMSRNPGIGRAYYNLNQKDIYDYDEIINSKGKAVKVPRYFDRLLDKEDHRYALGVKEMRDFMSEFETQKRMKITDKTLAEQMKIEEETMKQKQKIYNRERIR